MMFTRSLDRLSVMRPHTRDASPRHFIGTQVAGV